MNCHPLPSRLPYPPPPPFRRADVQHCLPASIAVGRLSPSTPPLPETPRSPLPLNNPNVILLINKSNDKLLRHQPRIDADHLPIDINMNFRVYIDGLHRMLQRGDIFRVNFLFDREFHFALLR
ncbi:protein of unknown function (plasmid) [Caballeronia sp. S22]